MPENTEYPPQTPGVITRAQLSGTEIERRAETAATAAAAQARAMIEFRFRLAVLAPRDWDEVRLRILKECERPGFAREALYHKPIGEGVTGLSIRFAEVAARCMRNLSIETMATFDDDQKRISHQLVLDLESNLDYGKDIVVAKTVERRTVRPGQDVISRRINNQGTQVFLVAATEDDLLNKEGSQVSKAIRTGILRLLPGDIQAEAREKIAEIQAKQDAADPEGQKKTILDSFYRLGVKPVEVKAYVGHELDRIAPEELARLRGLHNAIRDGEANMRDAIEFAQQQRGEKPAEGGAAAGEPATTAQKIVDKVKRGRPKKTAAENADVADPAAGGAEPSSVPDEASKVATEAGVKDGAPAPFDAKGIAAKLQEAFVALTPDRNIAKAEICLSEATGGKIQRFAGLADVLAEKPGWVDLIDAYLTRRGEVDVNNI